jgi:hypothetical protein
LQPGGHRFEPGILQPSLAGTYGEASYGWQSHERASEGCAPWPRKRRRRAATVRLIGRACNVGAPDRKIGRLVERQRSRQSRQVSSLFTIEYPENGSFFRPQPMQCVKELSRVAAERSAAGGWSDPVASSQEAVAVSVSFEFKNNGQATKGVR